MNFKHLLEQCLINFKENNNGFSGYTEGVDSYNNFLDTLTKNGYSFSTRSSCKWKHEKEPRFHFTVCGKVPHLDSPFLLKQSLRLQCIHGPKYYKRRKEVPDDHPTRIKRRKRDDSKKKINCPVALTVTEIKLFYTFKLTSGNISKQHKYNLKEKLLSTWKEEPTITRFYFTISGDEHNHDVNKTFASQIIHESVKKEITKLYDEGTWSVSAIEKVLSNKSSSFPQASAFKPNKRSIYNVVYKHIRRKNQARFDEESVNETLVEEEEEGNDWEEYIVGGLSPVHVEEVVSSPPPVVVAITQSFDEREVKANLRKFRQNLKDLMELTYVYDKNMDVGNALEDFIARTEEMKVTFNNLVSKPEENLASKKRVVQVHRRPREDNSAEPIEDTVIYIYDDSELAERPPH